MGDGVRASLVALLFVAACATDERPEQHSDDGGTAVPAAGNGGSAVGGDAGADAGADAAADAMVSDQPPLLTDALRAELAKLRYDDGPPPEDPSNRVADDPAARAFGQRLFFEPALSGPLLEGDNDGSAATLGSVGEPGKVSCAGCHVPSTAFVDTRSPHQQISLAARWTKRRTPSLLEVAFAPLYNWDGRRDSIWGQALGVMESDAEFNSGRLFVALQLYRLHRSEYEAVFGAMPELDDAAHFPQLAPSEAGCVERGTKTGVVYDCRGKPGDGADYDAMSEDDQRAVSEVAVNATKAIEAYVRLLRCGESRFDHWLDGDQRALDAGEQRGAALFAGRAQCAKCHGGPNLTDGAFHNVGLAPAQVAVAFVDANDRGAADGIALALVDPMNTRGEHSDGDRGALPDHVDDALIGAFRTPSLRCITARPSFMHTGQIRSLAQVVAFFARGGDPAGQYPGMSELHALDLSEQERADVTAFLGTLEGAGPEAALLAAPE